MFHVSKARLPTSALVYFEIEVFYVHKTSRFYFVLNRVDAAERVFTPSYCYLEVVAFSLFAASLVPHFSRSRCFFPGCHSC